MNDQLASQTAGIQSILTSAPRILSGGDRITALASPVIGIVAGIALSVLFYHLAAPGSMMANVFDPNTIHSLIPYGIFCVFFWGLTICLFCWWRLMALRRVSNQSYLDQVVRQLLLKGDAVAVRSEIDTPACRASPLLHRIGLVLEQWVVTPGLQDAEVILGNQADMDVAASTRRYSIVRVIVWALPVMGLIGTVLGIADAVGGFANFLGQDVSDVGQIRRKLVDVTGGLSFAFLITLQGLITSLVVMITVSYLQGNENRVLARLQRMLLEDFMPALQRAVPAARFGHTTHGAAGDDDVRQLVNAAIEAIRFEVRNAVQSIDEAAREQVRSISELSSRLATSAGTIATTGTSAIENAAQGVFGKLRDERNEFIREVQNFASGIAMVLDKAMQNTNHAVSTQAAAAERISETTERISMILTQVEQQVDHAAAGRREMEEILSRAESLHGSDTLDRLRSSLEQINQTLGHFRQPFVLQAVAVPAAS
jgi:biopolymer transport protein ExbB/TolQ